MVNSLEKIFKINVSISETTEYKTDGFFGVSKVNVRPSDVFFTVSVDTTLNTRTNKLLAAKMAAYFMETYIGVEGIEKYQIFNDFETDTYLVVFTCPATTLLRNAAYRVRCSVNYNFAPRLEELRPEFFGKCYPAYEIIDSSFRAEEISLDEFYEEDPIYIPPDNKIAELLTIKECSELATGLSENTIRQMCKQDVLPYVRAGQGKNGKILIKKSDFTDFLNRRNKN